VFSLATLFLVFALRLLIRTEGKNKASTGLLVHCDLAVGQITTHRLLCIRLCKRTGTLTYTTTEEMK
jgi:hypothetical protein